MDLRVNYDETITTGNNVTNKGEEFEQLLNKINAVNNNLKAYWEGQDASKYSNAVEQQAQTMKALQETIVEIGAFLVKAGNSYKEVSEANASGINL